MESCEVLPCVAWKSSRLISQRKNTYCLQLTTVINCLQFMIEIWGLIFYKT